MRAVGAAGGRGVGSPQLDPGGDVDASGGEAVRGAAAAAAVPWSTVLPLAAVCAYADGFWVITFRGAAGAIERADPPFRAWLTESTLVLPVFVFAVLAALTLALRWFGPVLRRPRQVTGTLVLVAMAGSVVGIAGIAASAAYDYQLQASQLGFMEVLHGSCSGDCTNRLQQTLDLQVRSVGFGSGLIVATNLVAVAWATALRGGRVELARRPRRHRTTDTRHPVLRSPADHDLRLLLATGLAAVGVIHLAVLPAHVTEWPLAGVFFALLSAAALVAATLVLIRPNRLLLLGTAALSAGPIAVWLMSRTLGMPFGPDAGVPEPVGLADSSACLLELATLTVSIMLVRGRAARPAWPAHQRSLALVATIAVLTIGVGASGMPGLDAFAPVKGHAHSDSEGSGQGRGQVR